MCPTAQFDSATFTGDTRFLSAAFARDAWFNAAAFAGPASFERAIFTSTVSFQAATFTDIAWLHSAAFEGLQHLGTTAVPAFTTVIDPQTQEAVRIDEQDRRVDMGTHGTSTLHPHQHRQQRRILPIHRQRQRPLQRPGLGAVRPPAGRAGTSSRPATGPARATPACGHATPAPARSVATPSPSARAASSRPSANRSPTPR
ncbi:putative ATP-grasp-modified RiPP [Kitasatospora sp. NPDC059571]|uniref:putative ATP-grasp-modified RiPP n=1 Tax=Kitasatospora sp. NPDC059571 TaxID=3346871 RepID=UPI0036957246